MPTLDGFEATRKIREQSESRRLPKQHSPKIVALSATSYQTDKAAAYDAGCDDFIRKPFSNTAIFEALAKHLEVRYSYKDEITLEVSPSVAVQALDATALSELPDDLLNDLEAATLRLQWDTIFRVIEQVRDHDKPLAEALTHTVNNFQYRQILETIQTISL